ncbi:MAG: BON domain-containing protein [Alphaproteobacteria bacterium]
MSTNTQPGKVEQFVDDIAIIAKIKAKYAADDLVNTTDINVKSDKGHVTLTGTVKSQAAYDQAINIAKQTSGADQNIEANLEITEDADASY